MFSFKYILVPPLVIEGPMNRQILEGDSVTFKCIAMAEPDHSIQWEFNGQIISANSSKYILSGVNAMDISMLTIINVVTEDVGEYTCNAINEHGTANASATLEVQGMRTKSRVTICTILISGL